MNIFKGKEDQIKEKTEYNLKDIAMQLGINERIANNYNFLMDFKKIVVSACYNSRYNDLYNKVEKDRMDLKFAKDIKLNKDETQRVISEIKEKYSHVLSEEEKEEWKENNTPEENEEESYDAMHIDKKTGNVYFQWLNLAGEHVFRESEIDEETRYKADENGKIIKDTLYDYSGYSTGYHEEYGRLNECITKKQINYKNKKAVKVFDLKDSVNNNEKILDSTEAINYNDLKSNVIIDDEER